jgi:hypothetical protein
MKTRNFADFYAELPLYVFVDGEAEINPSTNLPYNEDEMCIVDIDDVCTVGLPMDEDGGDRELWAVILPDKRDEFQDILDRAFPSVTI